MHRLALLLAWLPAAAWAVNVPFGARIDLAAGVTGSAAVAAADLDGDGDLDVLLAGETVDAVILRRNLDGSGTNWQTSAVQTNFDGASEVQAVDMDRDGDLDVVATAFDGDTIAWWANNGGVATNWIRRNVSTNYNGPRGVRIADLDNDGDPDLASAGQLTNDVSWWENVGGQATNWTKHTLMSSLLGTRFVEIADLDRDGDLDVAASSSQLDSIGWFENNGNATAWTTNTIAVGVGGARGLAVADMDMDGDPDVAGAAFADDSVLWWQNNGSGGGWAARVVSTNADGANAVSALDFDSDGDIDLVGTALNGNEVLWWENLDGLGIAWTQRAIDASFTSARGLAVADLDADGDPDPLAAGGSLGAWWKNQLPYAPIVFNVTNLIASPSNYLQVGRFGDLNGDGLMDVVSASSSTVTWYASGGGPVPSWTPRVIGTGTGALHLALTDLDQDGDLDVLGASYDTRDLLWWDNLDATGTSWQARLIRHYIPSGQRPQETAAADIDRDGDLDVAVALQSGDLYWYANDGTATNWTQILITNSYETATTICMADLDGDGDLDTVASALVGAGSTNSVAWWENTASVGTSWVERTIDTNGFAANRLIAVDFDRDGDLDLAGCHNGGGPSLTWWENVGGAATNWIEHPVESVLGAGSDLAVQDIDFDGDQDILLVRQGALAWYENDGSDTNLILRPIYTFSSPTGNALDLADVDRDGRPDALLVQGDYPSGPDKLTWFRCARPGDLSVTKTATPVPAFRGEPLTYTVLVSNRTSNAVAGLTVTDTLPARVTWLSDTAGLGPPSSNRILVWNIDLLAGASATSVDVTVQVDLNAALYLTNRAAVAGHVDETNLADNAVSLISTVDYARVHVVYTNYAARALETADAQQDGDPDIAVISGASSDWFLNEDVGTNWTFIDGIIGGGLDCWAGDLDADGDPDLLDATASSVHWLMSGTNVAATNFSQNTVDPSELNANDIDGADIDRDGDPDAVLSSQGSGFSWYSNPRSPLPGSWVQTLIGSYTGVCVCTGDFDGDGDIDVIGATSNNLLHFANNDGTGSSWSATSLAGLSTSAPCRSIYPADMDGDGDLDLVLHTQTVTWQENPGSVAVQWPSVFVAGPEFGTNRYRIFPADIDRDGDQDILRATPHGLDVCINVDGAGRAWRVGRNSDTNGVLDVDAADFDLDGDLDPVASGASNKVVSWWENLVPACPTNFPRTNIVASSANGVRALDVADFDRDGDLDIVGALELADVIRWWENLDGQGTAWDAQLIDNAISGPETVAAGDIDRDGDMDVVSAGVGSSNLLWWANSAGGTNWAPRVIATNFPGLASASVADVDRDGRPDIVAASWIFDAVYWWRNVNGLGTLWTTNRAGFRNDLHAAATGDIDGDGALDIVGASTFEGEVYWYGNTNENGLSWSTNAIDLLATGVAAVATGDLNGDGDLDVLGALDSPGRLVWWRNQNGLGTVWRTNIVVANFSGANGIRAGDVDCDGDQDVVGSNSDTGDVVWVENLNGNGTSWSLHTLDTNMSYAASPLVADIDGDGDPDVLAAQRDTDTVAWYEQSAAADADGDTLWDEEDTDADGDGIPNAFEQVNGLDEWYAPDAEVDADGDGFINRDEYVADTLPGVSGSYLGITELLRTNQTVIRFDSSTNRMYTLQFNTNLLSGSWSNLPGQVDIPGLGLDHSVNDTNAAGARNYRIQVEVP